MTVVYLLKLFKNTSQLQAAKLGLTAAETKQSFLFLTLGTFL